MMRLPRSIVAQLIAFAVVAIVAIAVLAVGYAHAPAQLFGVGRYTVKVQLDRAAGLYPRANVTYRGTEVGRVERLDLAADHVTAVLSLDRGIDIPADVIAEVHSQSAIGEQFVALVPRSATGVLADGAVIGVDRTSVPPDLDQMLDHTNTALEAIPGDNLQTVVDESYQAFGGMGSPLSRMISGATSLAIDAQHDLPDLTNIVDNSGPLLDSQADTGDAISAWAAHLADITGQLRDSDPAVRDLLHRAAPAAEEVRALLDRFEPSLPVLLANLVSVDNVALVYRADIEQLLVLVPQAVQVAAGIGMANLHTKQDYSGAYQQLVTNLNIPPPCTTGYLPANQRRSAVFEDYPDRPAGDVYCRIPQDSRHGVRGARNIPCEGKPGKRAPTVWMCESDQNYVPLNDGNNWKGDPNATFTGQDIPQLPPTSSSDGRPPDAAPPTALSFADYNPANGTYLGSDGRTYTQSDLAAGGGPKTWQQMLTPPGS